MDHQQAIKELGHDPQRTDGHYPNAPRVRDAQGNKVNEPTQCVRCAQTWPCETYVAQEQVRALMDMIAQIRAFCDETGHEDVLDFMEEL